MKFLTDLVDQNPPFFRSGGGVETFEGFRHGFATELKSGMVNGEKEFRPGFLTHAPSLFWSAMKSNPGIVGSHGHDDHIETFRACDASQFARVCRIPGKKNAVPT